MDIVCFLSLSICLSRQGTVRQKMTAPGLGGWWGQAAPCCPQQGLSPAAPAQGGQGRDGGSGWGQPRPGYHLHAALSQVMVQGCSEAPSQGWPGARAAGLLGVGGDCRDC